MKVARQVKRVVDERGFAGPETPVTQVKVLPEWRYQGGWPRPL